MSVMGRLGQVLAELELMPHGTTQSWDPQRGGGEGVFPRGGSSADDRLRGEDAENFNQKSAGFFRRQLELGRAPHRVLEDAERSLKFWRRPPAPSGLEPERGSFAFKRMIANRDVSPSVLHREYGLSRATVYAWREMYRDEDSG